MNKCPDTAYSLDRWHGGVCGLRQFLKGWGLNARGEYKRQKQFLLDRIQEIDSRGQQSRELPSDAHDRALLEANLENLMEAGEIYWRERGGEKWLLEGDANTCFFHLVANGRRRKKTILSLDTGNEGEATSDPNQIQKLIYDYYKQIFGRQQARFVGLSENVWAEHGRFSNLDNDELLKPFSIEEVKKTVFSMKENTAPRPDGFSVSFYKQCWEVIKDDLMLMVNDFYMGHLDISRLNYGVITLVPKVKEANNVKQFRPICLLMLASRFLPNS